MKLSPPASSSDLEAAREIARRLHQQRRREDRPYAPPPVEPPRPAPPGPPEAPSWDQPVGAESTTPEAALDALVASGAPPAVEEPPADVGGPPLEMDAEEPAVSPEEMVGAGAPEPPPLEELPEPVSDSASPSPFEVELDEAPADEVIDLPAPPSWDAIVFTCLDLAHAQGAMLVDPAGQVFAARGEWPEPGPDAIAAKLVTTMGRTLKDAPTRSISAPLMGKHLTAWRVPLAEGLVTAAFIGEAPVRAEARPSIDAEIHRGSGA